MSVLIECEISDHPVEEANYLQEHVKGHHAVALIVFIILNVVVWLFDVFVLPIAVP